MQSTMRIIVATALLASAIASAYHSSAKLRRDGVMNLYPFPRVGRSSQNTWQLPLNDLYREYEPQQAKRQLYAFPRVGRSALSHLHADSQEYQPMGVRRTESSGLWFGPRLGRGYKSGDDEIIIPRASDDHSDSEQAEPEPMERRKRQTRN